MGVPPPYSQTNKVLPAVPVFVYRLPRELVVHRPEGGEPPLIGPAVQVDVMSVEPFTEATATPAGNWLPVTTFPEEHDEDASGGATSTRAVGKKSELRPGVRPAASKRKWRPLVRS